MRLLAMTAGCDDFALKRSLLRTRYNAILKCVAPSQSNASQRTIPGAVVMVKQRVVHQAENRLGSSSHLFLRHVACRMEDGVLCLEGKVPSFYLKQTAQSLLQSLDGVERVVNRLEVVNAAGVSSEPEQVR